MSLSLFVRKAVLCCGLILAAPSVLLAGANYRTNGGEYAIAGAMPSDQVHPKLALNGNGGFIVWEDNRTDGDGLGISARQLGTGLTGVLSPFRVNELGAADQERPVVTTLNSGGAAFAWQGGVLGSQRIYARFFSQSNTWITGDIQVSSGKGEFQINPVMATLANGNVVVVWTSYGEYSASSMKDVYGQILSTTGEKIGGQFIVNTFTSYNQRTPAVAALQGGGFIVVWISEQQRNKVENPDPSVLYDVTVIPSVDVYGRVYTPAGAPAANEFLINTNTSICANPVVASGSDGGFIVAWSQKDTQVPPNSWDIFARPYTKAGIGGATARINTQTYGEQFDPQLAASGSDYFLVWNSLGQDGSLEGVYGQFLNADASISGSELRINTTIINKQIHPSLATDGAQFLVAWSSYVGGVNSFDLLSQRFVNAEQPLVPMDAPFVNVPFELANGVYRPQMEVSWPVQAGIPADHYEVFMDGAAEPKVSVGSNVWLMTSSDGLVAGATHSFRVAYVTADGMRSPLSASTSATAWSGYNWGGIPFEWMTAQYGADMAAWPSSSKNLADTGPTVLEVFIGGGSPNNPDSWLRTKLEPSSQGYFLKWNPQPGRFYQVQTSGDLASWTDIGGKRFASGDQDSLPVGNSNSGYYRVVLMR
jgi:hypothetical protein